MRILKIIIIGFLFVVVFINLYVFFGENYLYNEYAVDGPSGEKDLIILSSNSLDVSISKRYILPGVSFLSFFVPKTLSLRPHLNLCFENVSIPNPLIERLDSEWFTTYGYVYSPIYSYAGAPTSHRITTEGENIFFGSLPVDKPITKAKLTKDTSCKDYEKVKALYEYKVEYLF